MNPVPPERIGAADALVPPFATRSACCTRHFSRFPAAPAAPKTTRLLKDSIFRLGAVLGLTRRSVSRSAAVSYPDSRGWSKGPLTWGIRDRLPGSATLGFDHDPCFLHIQTLLRHDALASSVSATTPVMVCASWGNRRFGARLPLSGCASVFVHAALTATSYLFQPPIRAGFQACSSWFLVASTGVHHCGESCEAVVVQCSRSRCSSGLFVLFVRPIYRAVFAIIVVVVARTAFVPNSPSESVYALR